MNKNVGVKKSAIRFGRKNVSPVLMSINFFCVSAGGEKKHLSLLLSFPQPGPKKPY
jgi:hypothetical protein